MDPLNQFVDAYAEALSWTEGERLKQEVLDAGLFGVACALAPETIAQIHKDCQAFLDKLHAWLDQNAEEPYEHRFDYAWAGHNFWLTRNGHGAGFWDSPKVWDGMVATIPGESLTDFLTALSKQLGGSYAYLGDDGKVYLS